MMIFSTANGWVKFLLLPYPVIVSPIPQTVLIVVEL
jgi:hypothetical protein